MVLLAEDDAKQISGCTLGGVFQPSETEYRRQQQSYKKYELYKVAAM
jgi:hypothetical protein